MRRKDVADPLSREDIRILARQFRKQLGSEAVLWVPVVELLDILAYKVPGFSYEIVPDDALPDDIHGETDIRTGHIRIKESVYERACDGKGRDRMTIAHEIAHFFLICLSGVKVHRSFRRTEW